MDTIAAMMKTMKDMLDVILCDTFNITDEFDDEYKKTELFPCEECDDIFEEYDNVREHFLKEHKRYERIGCIEKSCKITFKDLLGLKSLCLFFNFKGTLFYKTFSSESI